MPLSWPIYCRHSDVQCVSCGAYLLSDLLLHLDGGAQLCYLPHPLTSQAPVLPQHIVPGVRGADESRPMIGASFGGGVGGGGRDERDGPLHVSQASHTTSPGQLQ